PSPDPMPSPPRQSSPPPIPFGPAPTSRVVSTDPILDIPSSPGPSEPVMETITFPFRDDDTGDGSFHESPPRLYPAAPTLSPTRIATLEAELKATKILHRDTVVLFAKRIKKLEGKLKTKKRKLVLSDSENEEEARQTQELDALLDLANETLHEPSLSTTPYKPANPKQSSEQEINPTTLDAVLTLSQSKTKARAATIIYKCLKKQQAKLDRVALNLANEEWIGLVDQVWANPTLSAKLLGADVSEDTFSVKMVKLMNRRRKAIAEIKAKAKREKPMTPAQQKEFMRTFVKNQSSVIYSTGWTWKDEITSVSAGATIAVGDPIPAVTYVSAGFSVSSASCIPAATPIAAGVSTTAGASGSASEASVPIIELLDSPLKDTSLPLDSETKEQDAPLRKSSRKKSITRKRTLPSPSKPKSDALSFNEDDPKAEFKRYLRQASDDDEPAEPISLALISDITTREIIPIEADLMVLYGLVSDKYKTERATGIGLGLWMDLRTLITAREERDASIIWDDHDQ
nr:hypothetical protein [Tanacetum cinerariifolium]